MVKLLYVHAELECWSAHANMHILQYWDEYQAKLSDITEIYYNEYHRGVVTCRLISSHH